MEERSARGALDKELEKLAEVPGGGPEAAAAFEALRAALYAARALAQEVLGKSTPDATVAVFDRFMRIWGGAAAAKPRDAALDRGEASFDGETEY